MTSLRLASLPLWLMGVWLAAGAETACGWGMPGPVFLVAIAAGLWAGPWTGACIGAAAGLADAILGSQTFAATAVLTIGCATAAGLLARWLARRHLLVGLLAAFASSLLAGVLLAALTGQPAPALLRSAAARAGENTLWMIPIYGIVLVVSWQRSTVRMRGDN